MNSVIVNGVDVTAKLAHLERVLERAGHIGGLMANELHRIRHRMTLEEQAHMRQLIRDWEALYGEKK